MAATSVYLYSQGSSVASCFSGRLSRISKWVWLRGHRIHPDLLPLCWDSEHTRFLNVLLNNNISDSCKPSARPYTQALLAFKAKYSGGFSFQCRIPNLKAWCRAPTPHSLGRTSVIVIVLPFMGHLWGDSLDCTASPSLLPISLWILLYILIVENLSF